MIKEKKGKKKSLIVNYLNKYFRNVQVQLWMQKDLFMKQSNMQYAAAS